MLLEGAALLALVYLGLRVTGFFAGGVCRSDAVLAGRVVVVTGANTGIGLEAAIDFVRRGVSTIVLGCRDMKKAESAVSKLKAVANSSQNIILLHLDLADLASVETFAQSVKERVDKVHLLVNNAGLFGGNGGPTKDGYELHFGVNYLGHFKLTVMLESELTRAAADGDVRIVNVSSAGHAFTMPAGLDVDNAKVVTHLAIAHVVLLLFIAFVEGTFSHFPRRFGRHEGWKFTGYFAHHRHYGQSKLAQIYHAYTLNQKFAKKNIPITAYSLHPGTVRTEITRHHLEIGLGHMFNTLIELIFALFGKSVVEGTQTTLHCSVAKEAEASSGEYFVDCAPVKLQGPLEKEKTKSHKPDKLWDMSLKMLGLESSLD